MVRQAPTKINDYDRNALEAAAQLRERLGAEVVIGCVGPAEAAKTLKEALAYGADQAVLVSGPWAEGLDSSGAAKVLSAIAVKEGPFDLVLSGDVSEDGYDGLVPGLIAAELPFPFLRGVKEFTIDGGAARVTRVADESEEVWELTLPAALSVTRLLNTPRTITTMQVMKVPMSRVRTVSASEVGLDESALTSDALAVRSSGVRPAAQARQNDVLSGEPDEIVAELVKRLDGLGVLS